MNQAFSNLRWRPPHLARAWLVYPNLHALVLRGRVRIEIASHGCDRSNTNRGYILNAACAQAIAYGVGSLPRKCSVF